MAQILGDGTRQKTRAFSELQSHYLFAERFGRPGKGNDKGKVEGLVGYARRNFLVPLPRVSSYAALNQHLLTECQQRRAKVLRGHQDTIGKRFEWDQQALLPLPGVPYEACEKQATRVSSLSLVRYRANDYSVPVEFGHREVVVKGYVHEVVIHCGTQEIARHVRCYAKHDAIYEPRHYLPLLEQKTNALDQAENQGLPVSVGKVLDCFENFDGLIVMIFLGIFLAIFVNDRVGGFCGPLVVRNQAPVKVSGQIAGDGCQPCAEACWLPQSRKSAKSQQEHILRKIVHVGPRHPGKQNAMDHASIAIVKSTEGSPITMACRAHKHGIV